VSRPDGLFQTPTKLSIRTGYEERNRNQNEAVLWWAPRLLSDGCNRLGVALPGPEHSTLMKGDHLPRVSSAQLGIRQCGLEDRLLVERLRG
jgi:hypothetical protein